MQKDSFLQSKTPVVQFSKLDQNNKAQFLQFLIKNNITFDNASGKQNVIAKVTLKTLKPNKNNNKLLTLNNNNNNETKKINKQQISINKKQKKVNNYADKQNNQHFYQNKKQINNNNQLTKLSTNQINKSTLNELNRSTINELNRSGNKTNKSPLNNKTFINNQKHSQTSVSPFKNVNINQRGSDMKINLKKSNINQSSISLKSTRNNNNIKQSNILIQNKQKINRQRTPQRKIYGQQYQQQINKSGNKNNQKSGQKNILVKKQITISPVKSQNNIKYTKQSHQKLSNFNKNKISQPYFINIKQINTKNQINTNKQKLKQNKSIQKLKQNNNSFKKNKQNNNSIKKVRDKTPTSLKLHNQSKQNLKLQKQKQKQKIFNISSSNQHSFNAHNTHKNQSFQIQQRIQLVNKYKEYFTNFNSINNGKSGQSTVIKQRPVCWPLNQVQRFLDQFYDDNFTKNTNQILNGGRRLNESLSKGSNIKKSHIVQSLQRFLNKKFNKVQKAIQYNLINLLYSIAYYINDGIRQQQQNRQQYKMGKQYKMRQQQYRQNGSIIGLRLFEQFLRQYYSLEQYLFFLFSRNILKQDFKKSFISSLSLSLNNNNSNVLSLNNNVNSNLNNGINNNSCMIINKKQIDKFLKHIVGQNNAQILVQYHKMIFEKVVSYQIDVNKFMNILIQDYRIKRQAAQQSHRDKIQNKKIFINSISHNSLLNHSQQDYLHDQDSSLQNTFNKILNIGHNRNDMRLNLFDNSQQQIIRQDSMQQLTFGQDTKQMLKQVQLEQNKGHQINNDNKNISKGDYKFWQSPYINKGNENIQKDKLLKDEFNQMIAQKLCQKTIQLVQLLSNNNQPKYKHNHTQIQQTSLNNSNIQQNYQFNNIIIINKQQLNDEDQQFNSQENQYQQIQQLLFSKSLCLFFTVIEMNKVKWLKQLHITNPTQYDIQKVQEIQLFFRKIKDYPTAKDIAEFSKLILTVTQITQELCKFFV